MPQQKVASVHLAEFPSRNADSLSVSDVQASSLRSNWERIFAIRDEVMKALEEARNEKRIGSTLEAKIVLTTDAATTRFLLDYYEQLRYIFIVSQVEVHEGDAQSVEIRAADGEKCERCWNYSTQVGEFTKYGSVCERCADALDEIVTAQ